MAISSNTPSLSASVLVVDDEPDLRTLYELTLLREGHAVVAAADLAQAREWLAQQRFDVLISDMRLPDGLGLELLRELTKPNAPRSASSSPPLARPTMRWNRSRPAPSTTSPNRWTSNNCAMR